MDSGSSVATVRRAVQRLGRRLRAERPVDGLSTTKLSVLAQLMDHGDLTSGDLARIGRTTPQALTRSVEGLVRDGYVSREPRATDRRQHMLRITPAGRAELARDAAPRDAWLTRAMDELLTPAEHQILAVAAELMWRLAEHDAAVPR